VRGWAGGSSSHHVHESNSRFGQSFRRLAEEPVHGVTEWTLEVLRPIRFVCVDLLQTRLDAGISTRKQIQEPLAALRQFATDFALGEFALRDCCLDVAG